MSTFTNWDGPQGSNVRASDLAELALRYQNMLSELQAHINATPSTNNVHNIKDYIEPLISECAKTADVISRLNTYAKLTDIPNLEPYALKQDLNEYAKKVQLEDYVLSTTLTRYLKIADLTQQQVILDIQAAIAEIQSWFNNPNEIADFKHVVKTNAYFEGLVHALEQIKFTDKREAAYIGGSDDIGVYYILGMLEDKAGITYIKYVDDKPFSAVINFAITPNFKGEMSVTTDCELEGLKFKIVKGSDKDGVEHLYLAIQSTEWIPNFASYDGKGMFSTLDFEASGINFVPINSEGWKQSNGNCIDICDCASGKGFSFSQLATTVLEKRIYKEKDNPYVTYNDIKPLDMIGGVIYWDEWEEDEYGNRFAINVPDGYHACDGTPVLDSDGACEEFREKHPNNYPTIDYCMIKIKPVMEVN